jgi:hypothetical protein
MIKHYFKYRTWDTRYPDYVKKEYTLDVLCIDFDNEIITIPYKIDKERTEKIMWDKLEHHTTADVKYYNV